MVPGMPPWRGEPSPTPARPFTINSGLSASRQTVRSSASSSSRVRKSLARSHMSGGSVTCASQSNVAKSVDRLAVGLDDLAAHHNASHRGLLADHLQLLSVVAV